MAWLRVSQHQASASGRHLIELTADVPGLQQFQASVEIDFTLSSQDQEDIRWYLEDFLEFDDEPAPTLAHGIEVRIAEIGEKLFRSVFEASDESRALWAALLPHLASAYISIAANVLEATSIPWELLRAPKAGVLCLRCRAMVRTHRALWTACGRSMSGHPPFGSSSLYRDLMVVATCLSARLPVDS